MNDLIERLARETVDPYHHKLVVDPWLRATLYEFARVIADECAKTIEAQDVDPAFKLRMASAVREKFWVK